MIQKGKKNYPFRTGRSSERDFRGGVGWVAKISCANSRLRLDITLKCIATLECLVQNL